VAPDEKLAKLMCGSKPLRDMLGMTRVLPELKWLKHLMVEEESLRAWEIWRSGKADGYAFFVNYDGPPYIALWADHPVETHVAKDCFELLLPIFFRNTEEHYLLCFLPKPVHEEIHSVLIDGGFDEWDDNPTIDNDKVACYMLERHTFEAYYGDGGEEGGEQDGEFEGEFGAGHDDDDEE